MALTNFHTYFPPPLYVGATVPAFGNMLIDAAGESAAMVFFPPKTGNIHKIIFRTNTVTTGDTVDIRVETVSTTTGDPSGTLWNSPTNTTNVSQVIGSGDDNTTFTVTLTADATVTDISVPMAVVIVNGGGGGNMNIASTSFATPQTPYADLFASSAWTKSSVPMVLGLEYSDGSYAFTQSVWPISNIQSTSAYSTSSTPDEQGMVFTPPVDMVVAGAWVWADTDGDYNIVLYDTDGASTLTSFANGDLNIRSGLSSGCHFVRFGTAVEIAAGSTYRLILKPTTTTGVTLAYFEVPTAAAMDSFPGGQTFHWTSAKDPTGTGSWTDVTTRRPFMGLLVTQVHDGAGGGGGGGTRGLSLGHHRIGS